MRLAPKLTVLFLLLATLPTGIVGYLAYENSRETILEETINHLVSINLFKGNELKRWIENNQTRIEELAQRPWLRQDVAVLATHDTSNHSYHQARGRIVQNHLTPRLKYGGFWELFVMCPRHGIILSSTDEKQEGKQRETFPYFIHGKTRTYTQGIYYSPSLEQPALTVSTPIQDREGNLAGVLAGRLDLMELSKIIGFQTGPSRTEDTYLVNTFNFFVTEPRFGQGYALKKAVRTEGVEAGLSGRDGTGFYNNYRGVSVIGAYKWLPDWNMCILTEIDQSEAFAPVVRLAWVTAVIVSVLSTAAGFLGFFFARTITRPVRNLVAGAQKIGSGNLNHRVGTTSKDEIGELSRVFDGMLENLRTTLISKDELEKKVRARTAQIEAVNKELESFSYSVSHDLRAPLRAMDGFSAALLSGYPEKLNEQGRHYLNRIQAASQRMGELINDLLNLSRITRCELVPRPVDLSSLSREIMAELQSREPGRKAEFTIDPDMMAWGDPNLLRIVLENMLDNAWKFTGRRPLACIEVRMTGHSGEPAFCVRDNGVGFNMAYANKLFIPFQRLHGMREFPGTGIGLATVERIVTRHGGRVWAEAAVDRGAVFYFTLGGKHE